MDKEMSSRDEKLKAVEYWIASNPDIRAALLTSSLVNPLAPVDAYSDLDIELVFDDLTPYKNSSEWIYQFGEPLNIYEEDESYFNNVHAMKMVQFVDADKIDFKLYDKEKFIAETRKSKLPEDWDIGYRVLIDKDNLTKDLAPPSYQVSIIHKPSVAQFNKVYSDFWWDVSYLPKCLNRGDLFYYKFMFEHIIRIEYLEPMIEWYIGSKNNWKVSSNKHGRLFEQYLSKEEWMLVQATFAGADMKDNWKASFAMLKVFNLFAAEVANNLEIVLNHTLPDKTLQFFETQYQRFER